MTIGAAIDYTTAGYLQTDVIRAVPSRLTQVGGFNPSAAALFVGLFDQNGPLAGAETPRQSFSVPANGSFSWEPSKGGCHFLSGLVFGVSSTGDTYTELLTDIWLYAEGFEETP